VNNLLMVWNLLPPQKKIVSVLSIIAITIAVIGLGRLANTPNMTLLYSGLDSKTSSEIVTSLEQKSIAFEIRGDAIYVDAAKRDRARLSLAGEGLPANGTAGYELLDSLTGFGVTSQMFDATYWRAKEGELARTILASAQINMARVHIANPIKNSFDRNITPSASVTVSTKSGSLGMQQAEAIRHMVSASVSNLLPDQVTVIDAEYGVILKAGDTETTRGNMGNLDARADELRENIERLLSARVGTGNVIVEVMVEANTGSETVTERIIDPDGAVAISSDNEASSQNSSGGGNGAVTVASNLPDTGGAADSGQDNHSETRSRDRTNYDISETVRERIIPAGQIARLGVAVLVNGEYSRGNNGEEIYTPRSAEELTAFRALVESTVGFNAERGDVVTIEAMQFPQPLPLGTSAASGFLSGMAFNIPLLLQMLLLAIVTLVLGMFVVKPILTNPTPQLATLPLQTNQAGIESIPSQQVLNPPEIAPPTKDPVDILRDTIALRSEESNHLLRNWIESETIDNKDPVV